MTGSDAEPDTPESTVGPAPLSVDFPSRGGARSSTGTAKRVLAESVRGLDDALARRIEDEQDWRTAYPRHLVDLTRTEARSSEAALDVARRGLATAREVFVAAGPDGDEELGHATAAHGPAFTTTEVAGEGERETELVVPYEGRLLRGAALHRQLDDWVRRGITEPGFATAVGAVVDNPGWLDLRDRTFALVGAGAAMGPFQQLMAWGATVAAVDLPRPQTWQRLAGTARTGAGRMLAPVEPGDGDPLTRAGADLLSGVGRLRDWLATAPGPLTVGNYGYAPGALFVRLSMAFDLLLTELAAVRDDLSLAYLATPSDVFLVPADAVAMAQRRDRRLHPRQLAFRAARAASRGRLFRPNYEGLLTTDAGTFGLVDAFIVDQGPNYALAKRLQRWRTALTRVEGMVTSVHVAPPTRTASVHSNPEMERRQRLTAHLGVETFDADTVQALCAAVLVHDLRNPASSAHPATPLSHPHEAFMATANPGGRWRTPLEPNSSVPALARVDAAVRRTPLPFVRR